MKICKDINKIKTNKSNKQTSTICSELPIMSLLRQEPTWLRENNIDAHQAFSDPLAIIYNEGLWRLNKVSPLYNLQYSSVRLKQYASKVRQALVSALPSNPSTRYKVQIEEQAHLKYSEDDANSIVLTVSSSQGTNEQAKVVYSAILLSWGVSSSLDNATHLPYMLERGEQRIGTAVKSSLQTVFDCNIRQFSFTQHQLLQFGFNFVDNDTSRSNDPFTLVYRTPQVEHKDRLNLSFNVGDIHIIWNGIKDEVIKNSELVNLAYQMLQNQIFYMIMLDITMFDLCEVTLPKAEVKSNGIVKMKTPEIVNCVLTLLNEISSIGSGIENSISE